jgi:hypothetical protein
MASEDLLPGGSRDDLLEEDDLEEMLEILAKIAKSEGRDFLAYLLRMALMEARNHNAPTTHLSH